MYSGDPILQWHAQESMWELDEPFTVTWQGKSWKMPTGFKTDLASIPRVFRWLIPKVGKHIQPAVVHDWFYVYGGVTKEEADQMFLDGMVYTNVWRWRRYMMYWGVRANITGGIWGKVK